MVIVVMAHNHEIDPGQRIEGDSRLAYPLGAKPPQRAYTFRPHRVSQNVAAWQLDEDGCMTV
jgi:hypothetical protein